MSPWKVVFKDLSEVFQCAVVGPVKSREYGKRPVIPDVTLRLIPAESEDEAHYLAGLLNSTPSATLLHVSSVGVQTQRYHPSDLQKIRIPKYDSSSALHSAIVNISKRCHELAAIGDENGIARAVKELDLKAAEFWKIKPKELEATGKTLELLKRTAVHVSEETDLDAVEEDEP
jgi:hypothetical protein